MSSPKLHVLAHPVVNARLSQLRQTSTNSKEFREVRSTACTAAVLWLMLG